MKIFNRISIFLLSAVIFMSAFVVFGEEQTTQSPPSLNITLTNVIRRGCSGTDISPEVETFKDFVLSNRIKPAFYALLRDYPDATFWINQCSYSISVIDKKYLELRSLTLVGHNNYQNPKAMSDQLNAVISSFSPKGETIKEKLLSIHDYICLMNTYKNESEGALYYSSAYGALVDRRSVCEGYAEAFKLLCDRAGIDCVLVSGVAKTGANTSEEHMWNYVRMDDGKWYAVDVTWDDSGDRSGNTAYFLVGSETVIDGKTFAQTHIATYDLHQITGDEHTIEGFVYPTISNDGYEDLSRNTDYAYSAERYYYSFLTKEQQQMYDDMLAKLKSSTPLTQTPPPPPAATDDMVTTEPDNTTLPDTETGETTKNDTDTSVSDTQPSDSTSGGDTSETTDPDITSSDVTTEPEESSTETTETTDETTTDVTTVPNTTVPVTTEKDTTVTEKETETTTSKTETTEPITSATESTSSTETTPPESETTTDVTNSDTLVTETDNAVTTGGKPTKTSSPQSEIYKILTAAVIVCAITALSLILGIAVIRYTKKHNG